MRPIALLVLLPSVALAVPGELTHTGRVFDNTGLPLNNAHDVDVSLWDASSGGSQLYATSITGAAFDEGYFSLTLAGANDTAFDGDDVWIEMTIDSGTPMPRMKLASVPFARRAAIAGSVNGGVVDASEIRIGGNVVIDGSGGFSGTIAGDTLGNLTCLADQLPLYDGSSWGCGTAAGDTLANLSGCSEGDVVAWSATFSAWGCVTPIADWGDLTNVPPELLDGDDDTQLDEAAVDAFVGNNGYALSADLAALATSGDWADIANIPLGFQDGVDDDTQLTESDVDGFVANNGYALDSDIATLGKTGDWADIANIPGDFSDGTDDVLTEAQVETFISNGPINLAPGASDAVGIGTTSPQARLDVAGGIRLGDDTSTCTAANEGTLRWQNPRVQVCDGTTWTALTPLLGTPSNPALDCNSIRIAGDSTGDGVYTLFAGQHYCDMTTDGGGWTLIAKIHGADDYWQCGNTPGCSGSPWTDATTLNTGDLNPGASNDAKYAGYNALTASDIMFWDGANGNPLLYVNGAVGGNTVGAWISAFPDAGGTTSCTQEWPVDFVVTGYAHPFCTTTDCDNNARLGAWCRDEEGWSTRDFNLFAMPNDASFSYNFGNKPGIASDRFDPGHSGGTHVDVDAETGGTNDSRAWTAGPVGLFVR